MTFKNRIRMNSPLWRRAAAVAAVCLFLGGGASCGGQDAGDDKSDLKSTVAAPANMRSVGSVLGGAYFVDKGLLDRYEALKLRVTNIRRDISLGNATGDEALKSLAAIEKESKILRAELEDKKVLVAAFQVYSKRSEQTFPLGDERLVIITGDDLIVRGWEGPGLKVVVEKVVIAKSRPDDSVFDAIQARHELTVPEEMVGLTQEQREQGERKFLESENGRKLTEAQLASRRKLVNEIHHSYDDYLAFQGRQANTIQLTGLSFQEGNRNLTMRINSPQGGGTVSSQWQRHATMTVYVPACKSLAVRGCQSGLDIQDIECDLVLTTQGAKGRAYEGSFSVRGVTGDVTIDQVPVRRLSGVTGSVRLTATNEFVNSGTHHENGTRTFSPYTTHTTEIEQIGGDLRATILRTDLKLSRIAGVVDVVNEYGATSCHVDAVDLKRAHRIVSQSGEIYVTGAAEVLQTTPIYAHTQCGRLHTNLSREVLDDFSFGTGRPQRGWKGFVTPSEGQFNMAKFERPDAALENRPRAAGLDLISHAGIVSILTWETGGTGETGE